MAIQTTQIVNPQPEKNSSVNQSIRAATWRFSVGKANAARVASAGRASSKVRSESAPNGVAMTVTTANHSGQARCRCTRLLHSCQRQRQRVHKASGQAGQVNQMKIGRAHV